MKNQTMHDAAWPRYTRLTRETPRQKCRADDEKRTSVLGIVLAGGHGWAPAADSGGTCIPLLPVAGRPLLLHIVDWLCRAGVNEVSLCANSHTDSIRDFLSSLSDETFLSYYKDRMPRGPAGCARDVALTTSAESFVVAEGAMVPDIDLGAVLDQHARTGAAVTVVAHREPNSDAHNLQPAGVYVFSRAALRRVPDAGFQDIKEMLLPMLFARGERVVAYRAGERVTPRVTGLSSYLAVNAWAIDRLFRSHALPVDYLKLRGALVHRTARVPSTARFVGPVLIGAGTVVGGDAVVIGPASIGVRCAIERGCVVSRSAIWDTCRVAANAFLDRCVLTHGSEVEAELVARETAFAGSFRQTGAARAQALAGDFRLSGRHSVFHEAQGGSSSIDGLG